MEANYVTILYWFCHTLTWIRHRYTCVPILNPLPPPSPSHPSGSSQCTSPERPVSCIEPGPLYPTHISYRAIIFPKQLFHDGASLIKRNRQGEGPRTASEVHGLQCDTCGLEVSLLSFILLFPRCGLLLSPAQLAWDTGSSQVSTAPPVCFHLLYDPCTWECSPAVGESLDTAVRHTQMEL